MGRLPCGLKPQAALKKGLNHGENTDPMRSGALLGGIPRFRVR